MRRIEFLAVTGAIIPQSRNEQPIRRRDTGRITLADFKVQRNIQSALEVDVVAQVSDKISLRVSLDGRTALLSCFLRQIRGATEDTRSRLRRRREGVDGSALVIRGGRIEGAPTRGRRLWWCGIIVVDGEGGACRWHGSMLFRGWEVAVVARAPSLDWTADGHVISIGRGRPAPLAKPAEQLSGVGIFAGKGKPPASLGPVVFGFGDLVGGRGGFKGRWWRRGAGLIFTD